VQVRAAEGANGFHKGRENYTNIFHYRKMLPKGEMTTTNNIVK